MYLTILFFAILIELGLLLSKRGTQVSFLSHALIVHGLDLRIDLPLGDDIKTVSGVYGYRECESYSLDRDRMTIHLSKNRGVLALHPPQDKLPHLTAYLEARGIPRSQ